MTLRECYDRIGADYDGVMERMGKEERVMRYLLKIPGDPTFSELEAAMDRGNAEEAFRAAHTLKGLCMNFGLTRLGEHAKALTDDLRDGDITGYAKSLFERIRQAYQETIQCIRELDSGGEENGD